MRAVLVHRDRRFSLDVDQESGRTFVAIPVRNQMTEYDEYYEVSREDFERYLASPPLAFEFVERAKRRELDHLLLYPPGSDRGWAD